MKGPPKMLKVRQYPDGVIQYEAEGPEAEALLFSLSKRPPTTSRPTSVEHKMGLTQYSPEIRNLETWIRREQPKYLDLEQLYTRLGCRSRAVGHLMSRLVEEGLYFETGPSSWANVRLN